MSLVGNLEDLGLGDILQIVSLSRKSGILLLQSRNREGKIVFLDGQVIRATSSVLSENLGDLLVRRGLLDIATLKEALLLQKKSEPPPRLGVILSERFSVSSETIEEVVRGQIEKIVYSFFAWNEGTFSFELGEPSELAATSFNPLQFMLDSGLNPQWLAMEGSRILDEKRHRGEEIEEVEEPVVDVAALMGEDAPASSEGAALATTTDASEEVFFVDDDEETREGVAQALQERGYRTTLFADAASFTEAVAAAQEKQDRPILLIDLIMPRKDGGGILGGLELLEQVRESAPEFRTLVLSDHPNDEAEHRVRQLGVPAVITKPKKSDVRGERGIAALATLAETLEALLATVPTEAADSPKADGLFNLGAELRSEFGESSDSGRGEKGPETPGLFLLRGMLQELNNPSLGGGIILLVLRFASELMNRAVIFLVKDDEVVGLGQFGIESTEELADVRVRRMKIPRSEPSVFAQVVDEMAPMKTALSDSPWDQYLRDQLGGGTPQELFLGPLISEGRVVAVLYGDNLPEQSKIGDTESLEIFLSQAGLAMEKALLERRLRVKEVAG
ncbi:MAG: hypothetical protein C0621_07760 [Desulfuromonas sp.]|nr:MAG: hypothetical protein C0621_07760 [Desulfuromonas sp.]